MTINIVWGSVLGSVLLASWFFYRYVVPREWREWTRAGIMQAFIISFYAEMYGFPVTLYLLFRVFGLDLQDWFWDGNLWVYLTGYPEAMYVSMALGYAIAALGALVIVAGWREVYRARTEQRLATQGPYAFMRHPQYTGIFIVLFGEGVVHWPTIFSLLAIPVIVMAYVLLARKEEKQMLQEFGDEYRAYQGRTPMFVPNRFHGVEKAFAEAFSATGSRS